MSKAPLKLSVLGTKRSKREASGKPSNLLDQEDSDIDRVTKWIKGANAEPLKEEADEKREYEDTVNQESTFKSYLERCSYDSHNDEDALDAFMRSIEMSPTKSEELKAPGSCLLTLDNEALEDECIEATSNTLAYEKGITKSARRKQRTSFIQAALVPNDPLLRLLVEYDGRKNERNDEIVLEILKAIDESNRRQEIKQGNKHLDDIFLRLDLQISVKMVHWDLFSSLKFTELDQVLSDEKDRIETLGLYCTWDQMPASAISMEKLAQGILGGLRDTHCPTPIQMQAIPYICNLKDVVLVSKPGSGKTLAFLLPCINIAVKAYNRNTHEESNSFSFPFIIVSPTREIATQTLEVATRAIAISNHILRCNASSKFLLQLSLFNAVSGDPLYIQMRTLKTLTPKKARTMLMIGTPGRIMDLVASIPFITKTIILDEADRLFKHDFLEQTFKLVRALSPTQTVMVSATFPDYMNKYARALLKWDAVEVSVEEKNEDDDGDNELTSIVHRVVLLPESSSKDVSHKQPADLFSLKVDWLQQCLIKSFECERSKRPLILVYARSRQRCDSLYLKLNSLRQKSILRDFSISVLHGHQHPQERSIAIQQTNKGLIDVLIATDIATRGLHLPRLSMIVNFDSPFVRGDGESTQSEIKVAWSHRLGRLGRLGQVSAEDKLHECVSLFINWEETSHLMTSYDLDEVQSDKNSILYLLNNVGDKLNTDMRKLQHLLSFSKEQLFPKTSFE